MRERRSSRFFATMESISVARWRRITSWLELPVATGMNLGKHLPCGVHLHLVCYTSTVMWKASAITSSHIIYWKHNTLAFHFSRSPCTVMPPRLLDIPVRVERAVRPSYRPSSWFVWSVPSAHCIVYPHDRLDAEMAETKADLTLHLRCLPSCPFAEHISLLIARGLSMLVR